MMLCKQNIFSARPADFGSPEKYVKPFESKMGFVFKVVDKAGDNFKTKKTFATANELRAIF